MEAAASVGDDGPGGLAGGGGSGSGGVLGTALIGLNVLAVLGLLGLALLVVWYIAWTAVLRKIPFIIEQTPQRRRARKELVQREAERIQHDHRVRRRRG